MNLQEVRSEAISLMREHGLTDWTFKWDRTVGRFGFCDCTMKEIILSRPMTEHETNPQRVTNTILHEIAHALDCKQRGYTNHDETWQSLAKSIGCSGTQCSSSKDIDKKKFVKWMAKCGHCGKEYFRYHKPKGALSCSQCDTKYNPEFGLDFRFNPSGEGKY
jgi:predicted SprT family Zn-dependent metalloprotease